MSSVTCSVAKITDMQTKRVSADRSILKKASLMLQRLSAGSFVAIIKSPDEAGRETFYVYTKGNEKELDEIVNALRKEFDGQA